MFIESAEPEMPKVAPHPIDEDGRLVIDHGLGLIIAEEFATVTAELEGKGVGSASTVNLDAARAARVIHQVEQRIRELGYLPLYDEQKTIIAEELNNEPTTGLGDWRLTAKYGALLAMQSAEKRQLAGDIVEH